MQISPLQLNALWIGKVSLEPAPLDVSKGQFSVAGIVRPKAPKGQVSIDTVPTFGRSNDDPHQWNVGLRVTFKSADEQRIPYEGSVEMTGQFVISSNLSEEKQLQVIAVNAASILYSSVREFVAMLTAHGPHGKFILPSVSFGDLKLEPPNREEKKSAPDCKEEPADSRAPTPE